MPTTGAVVDEAKRVGNASIAMIVAVAVMTTTPQRAIIRDERTIIHQRWPWSGATYGRAQQLFSPVGDEARVELGELFGHFSDGAIFHLILNLDLHGLDVDFHWRMDSRGW